MKQERVTDILFWFKMAFALLFGIGAGIVKAVGIYVVLAYMAE